MCQVFDLKNSVKVSNSRVSSTIFAKILTNAGSRKTQGEQGLRYKNAGETWN